MTRKDAKGDEDTIQDVLRSFLKGNREFQADLKRVGKADDPRLESLAFEESVILEYLPQQLSEEALKQIIDDICAKNGLNSPSQMKVVMGELSKSHSGLYDGKIAAQLASERLRH